MDMNDDDISNGYEWINRSFMQVHCSDILRLTTLTCLIPGNAFFICHHRPVFTVFPRAEPKSVKTTILTAPLYY